ncbi:MAG: hypothetical protein ABIJ21_03915 [Nanoarchaeota archaeon]
MMENYAFIGAVILVLLLLSACTPSPPDDYLLRMKDIERSGFGEISDYKRSNTSPPGVESQETTSVTIKDKNASFGSQIIQYHTRKESKNIFELSTQSFNETDFAMEKNISIGEKGIIYRIDLGDSSIFYLLFYKDKSFVSLTLNYAKEEDEKELIGIARTIEKRLNASDVGTT